MKRSETSATATAAAAEFSAAQDPTGHFAVSEEAPADSSRFKAIGIGAAAVVLIGGSALWFTRSASKQPAVQPATVAAAAPAAVAPATTTPAPAPATATPSSTSAPHPGTDQTPPNAAKPAPQPPPRAAAEQPIAIRPSAAPPATTVVDVAPPAITTSSLQNAAVRSIPLLSNPETPVAAPVLPPTSTGAIPARLITRVQPVYPDQARHLGIGGAIQLSVAIGADGKVQKVTPRSGSAMLIPAAVTAVRQWRYEPSKLDGKAVPSTAEVTINFNVR